MAAHHAGTVHTARRLAANDLAGAAAGQFVKHGDGQRLAAFMVLGEGATATPDDLKAHVRENLANYKVPRAIDRAARG